MRKFTYNAKTFKNYAKVLLASIVLTAIVYKSVNTDYTAEALSTVQSSSLTSNTLSSSESSEGILMADLQCIRNMNLSIDVSGIVVVKPFLLLHPDTLVEEAFDVEISDLDDNVLPSDTLTCAHVGQTFKVSISESAGPNSCWGFVKIEDKFKPVLTCRNDTIICTEDLPDPNVPGYYNVVENCNYSINILNTSWGEFEACNDSFVGFWIREVQAIDESFNVSNICSDTVFVKRIDIDAVDAPPSVEIYCDSLVGPLTEDGVPYPADELGHPTIAGVPTIEGIPIYPIEKSSVCMSSVSFSDKVITDKGCKKRVMRTWQMYTWDCNGGDDKSLVQFIDIIDTVPPMISGLEDITIYADHHCEAQFSLPVANVSDGCTATEDIYVTMYVDGLPVITKNGDTTLTFGQGTHTILYRAKDAFDCQPFSEELITLTVHDGVGPVNRCLLTTEVSLTNGWATIDPSSIDQGTSDLCGGAVTFKLIRMEDACGFEGGVERDEITFCCEDAGKTIMVAMEATDESGNKNTCMVSVLVVDKTEPSILCPDDITIQCDALDTLTQDNYDAVFGEITLVDGCIGEVTQDLNDEGLNSCRTGIMIRTIIVNNTNGEPIDTCSQMITVEPGASLIEDSITWPKDYLAESGDLLQPGLPDSSRMPIVVLTTCQKVDITFLDVNIEKSIGECQKIERQWSVTDTCTGAGPFLWNQILTIIDTIDPVIDPIILADTLCLAVIDCDSLDMVINATGTDNVTPSEDLIWTWVHDYNMGTATGDGIEAVLRAPIGENTITYTATDSCGNSSEEVKVFVVEDCAMPIAVCKDTSVVIELFDTLMYAVITTESIDDGSSIPCNDEVLCLTFNGANPVDINLDNHYFKGDGETATEEEYLAGDAQLWDASTKSSSITVNCDDGTSIMMILTVTDSEGNTDTCKVTIPIDNEICIPPVVQCCENTNEFTGQAVVTCQSLPGSGLPVGAIYNVRDNLNQSPGSIWFPPEEPFVPSNWTADDLGQIFSITLDDSSNVYLASTDVYDVQQDPAYPDDFVPPFGTGQIFKARPPLFEAVPFISLPNTGGRLNGIGDIVFDKLYNQFFVSNLEDGRIYQYDNLGTLIAIHDPFGANDADDDGLAPQAAQIWGMGIRNVSDTTELYFAKIDTSIATPEREMYLQKLPGGNFSPSFSPEAIFTIPGQRMRISDIAFSKNDSLMLISERGTVEGSSPDAHDSQAFRYSLDGGGWSLDVGVNYIVGDDAPGNFDIGQNSAGGVSFGFEGVEDIPAQACDQKVWISNNFAKPNGSSENTYTYGIQGIDVDGNTSSYFNTDLFIDFDGIIDRNFSVPSSDDPVFSPKGQIGDVEVFGCGMLSRGNLANIFGEIKTIDDVDVLDTDVMLMDANQQTSITQAKVNDQGQYALEELASGMQYEVIPSKDGDDINGVSTLDLIHIQRHILGLQKLANPYDMIAGDVNNDSKISTSDLVELRKLVIGKIEEFPNNTSWRFIDRAQSFVTPENPWSTPFLESYFIDELNQNMDVNFIGIKIGDVNGTVFNNAINASTRNADLALNIKDRKVQAGEIIEISFESEDLRDIYGYQISLNVDFAEIINVNDDLLKDNNINITNHGVNISWNENKSFSKNNLFKLKLRASKDVRISDIISINKDVLNPNAYVGDELNVNNFQLNFEFEEGINVVLHQNRPNPFAQSTNIEFYLSQDELVTMKFSDVSGRLLKIIKFNGVRGENSLSIDKTSDLGLSSGTVFYELITQNQNIVRKMLLID